MTQPPALETAAKTATETAAAVDVTRHNFEAVLPAVKDALSKCTFFAFDCEMSGLFQEGMQDEYLDDMESRYSKLASNSQAFVVTQFGLSAFTHQPVDPALPPGTDRYIASTWNFYLFPRPPPSGTPVRRFLCDASALEFLACQGFDFNKFVADGVSYMPAQQYSRELRKVKQESQGCQQDIVGGVHTAARDAEFIRALVEEVRAWVLAGDAGEPTLHLTAANNSYLRLLAHRELARPQFGALLEGHPGFYVTKVPGSYWPVLMLVRATPEEAAAFKAAELEARTEALKAVGGFARVFDAIRRCGRPAVGHNCMFDVAFTLGSFAESPLPVSWGNFKRLASRWFTHGVYDTKHLVQQLPKEILGSNTALSALYKGLTGDHHLRSRVREYITSAGLPEATAAPQLSHAPECAKYLAVEAGALAHEAGYDAYMTGAVFVHLLPLLQAKAHLAAASPAEGAEPKESSSTEEAQDQPQPEPPAAADGPPPPGPEAVGTDPLLPARPLMGRLNVMKSDMAYAALFGTDPPLHRPNVFYVTGLPQRTHHSDVAKRFTAANLGKVRAIPVGTSGFLVEVDVGMAPLVLQRTAAAATAAGEPRMIVMPYSESVALRRMLQPMSNTPQSPCQPIKPSAPARSFSWAAAAPAPTVDVSPSQAGEQPAKKRRLEDCSAGVSVAGSWSQQRLRQTCRLM